MKLPADVRVIWGADPEVFLVRNGQVIGSERVIPEAGVEAGLYGYGKIVRDGIQVELNPYAGTLYHLKIEIASCLLKLQEILKHKAPDVEVSFDLVQQVSPEEFEGLSQKSRELGCEPSENYYGIRPIKADKFTYPYRSAGGHIHMGIPYWMQPGSDTFKYEDVRHRLAPFSDIIIGNTCVLFDRDKQAAFRRENYGRAGEYRRNDHGYEYRTPSNFWLRSPILMDLVFGLANITFQTIAMTLNTTRHLQYNLQAEFEDLLPGNTIKKFEKAINKNDARLALKNFALIKDIFIKYGDENGWPIGASNWEKFLTFVDRVQKNGLEACFPDSPFVAWAGDLSDKTWKTFIGQLQM